MPPTPAQGETFFQFKCLPLPEFDDGIGPLNPWPMVGMQVDWRIVERAAPLNHASNQVGMGDCQARYPTQVPYRLDGGIIDKADTIPQDISAGCLHKQGALTDCKPRLSTDPGQPAFERLEYVVMLLC